MTQRAWQPQIMRMLDVVEMQTCLRAMADYQHDVVRLRAKALLMRDAIVRRGSDPEGWANQFADWADRMADTALQMQCAVSLLEQQVGRYWPQTKEDCK